MRQLLCLLLMSAITACWAACGGADKPEPREPEPAPREKVAAIHDPSIHDGEDEQEDDGEEFEVEGLSGHLDPYDIERGIEPHSTALSDCFYSRVKKMKFLGGKVEMKYKVGRDGAVKSVQMKESSLGSWQVEKCLLDIARGMSFRKPRGKGDADFSVPLDFTSARSVRWLTEEAAESEVDEYLEQLAECEGRAPDVWVTLYVGARGKVKSVGFASQSVALEDEWAECAEQSVMAWQLTDPRGQVAKLSFLYNGR
jgi:TonB family protein